MSEFDELKKLTEPEINPDANEECVNGAPLDYSKAEHYDDNPEARRAQLMARLKLKNKILQYQEKFSQELRVYDYKMKDLDSLSNPDLEVFLDEIKIAVSQRNSANMTKAFYFGAVKFVEKASTTVGYDITGFHSYLWQQSDIHKCLDEIALEYEDSLYMPAYVRLPYITLQAALSLGQMRKTENIINNEMKKTIKKELIDEYADL